MTRSILARTAIAIPIALVLAVLVTTALGRGRSAPPPTLRELHGVPALTSLAPARTAVLLVDAQQEFVDGPLALRGLPGALAAAGALLDWARAHDIQVVHVRQTSKPGAPLFATDSPGFAPIAALDARPGELVVAKLTGGGFTRTDLDERLRARGIDTVIVAGFMTHHAVDMTARDAGARGYRVVVATDATATRDLPVPGGGVLPAAEVQRAALAILADRFAELHAVGEIAALPLAR